MQQRMLVPRLHAALQYREGILELADAVAHLGDLLVQLFRVCEDEAGTLAGYEAAVGTDGGAAAAFAAAWCWC